MSYQQPEVVSLIKNNNATVAFCDVRFVDAATTPTAGHRLITVAAYIPLDPGDPDDVIKARAISVAKQALRDATS